MSKVVLFEIPHDTSDLCGDTVNHGAGCNLVILNQSRHPCIIIKMVSS